ncbi:3-hydroxyacyl-ACP dehydratase FabZ [Mesoterricola sediminis]|uniref:3-hydroxyacyl-[acyl-carrier-protein] dehydratase FabZ n=1 Tax=Mesoterricola sediminis TaxID=2927980 RepID=A0AA48GSR5_9BACT|nr:3-hydroxyacyl-ACP dehydratase FabZ [Mesoterricola sediminis]BDU76989.1 3-hydroxyacyl-[acyl-carrier-protein] dehydratase FabZ [Mesoterricola sediminis]
MSETPERKPRTLDVLAIQDLLPHRYPILLVDRILDYEPGAWIRGVKNITMGELIFQGHFPKNPVFPGVLIVEAMAQTGGCLVLTTVPNRHDKLIYFMAIDNVKFRKPVVPGDQMIMDVKVMTLKGKIAKLRGEAFVDGQKVAEAEFMSMLVDAPQSEAQ